MATLPSILVCGCAFTSFGSPLVAQRVWPIPTVASGIGLRSMSSTRFFRRPAFLRTVTLSMPGAVSATPAESYPRYSRRSKPCRQTSKGLPHAVSTFPAYPTIPHMAHQPSGQTLPEANPTRRLCRIGTCGALAVPPLAGAVGGADWGWFPPYQRNHPQSCVA